MECYSAIKRNKFKSVLTRWMNLEPIIQSEVSQKEKDKYLIPGHIWRNGSVEFIYRAAVEKQTESRLMETGRGEERGRCVERVTWELALLYVR